MSSRTANTATDAEPVPASAAMRSRSWATALAASLLVAVISFATGYSSLGEVRTGAYSERVTFEEATEMAAGRHRYGIVDYTHFPNGPIYVVAVMTALGIPPDAMRLLPVTIMAAASGFLVWALWIQSASLLVHLWIVVGIAVLLVQPGVAQWQGALHEHSYVLAQALGGLAAAVLMTPRQTWLLLPFGFVAGWTGYDFLPGQACLLLLGRWLVLARDPGSDLLRAGLLAALDALKFVSGFALAILAHLWQLALYFDGLEAALRDLLGSALARAGAESAGAIDPAYQSSIVQDAERLQRVLIERPDFAQRFGLDYDTLDPSRFRLPGILLGFFLEPRWTRVGEVVGALLFAAFVCFEQLRSLFTRPDVQERSPESRQVVANRLAVLAVALGITIAAGISWSLLMRFHAGQHLHMVPRHYFMVWAGLLAVPVLAFVNGPIRPQPGAPDLVAGVRAAALYVAPLLALLGIGVYAAIGLG